MIDNVAWSNQFEPISAAESLEINGGAAQIISKVGEKIGDFLIRKAIEEVYNRAVDYITNPPKIDTWNYNGPRC